MSFRPLLRSLGSFEVTRIRAITASILRVVISGIIYNSPDQTYSMLRVATCKFVVLFLISVYSAYGLSFSSVGEVAAGILVGNLVVFPRFFATYSPKVMRLFSRQSRRRSSDLPSDAKPIKASPQGDYVELKDQRYKADIQVPYAGESFFITTSSAHRDDHEPPPREISESGPEIRKGSQIWKTVHVSQNARSVQ